MQKTTETRELTSREKLEAERREFNRAWAKAAREFRAFVKQQHELHIAEAKRRIEEEDAKPPPVRAVLRATHSSIKGKHLKIAGEEIPSFVLEDGTRVISQSGMIKALGIQLGGESRKRGRRGEGELLADSIAPKNVRPYFPGVSGSGRGEGALLRFEAPPGAGGGGCLAYGYPATYLADFCEAVLRANDGGALQRSQQRLVVRCMAVLRAIARVGIIALVDEATGYQEGRERRALNKILEMYISKELLPWSKRFPDEFYEHLFRLKGWTLNGNKRPKLIAKLTAELVYEKLPVGVLDHLRRVNPTKENGRRAYTHHQWLTLSTGNVHLDKQIAIVTEFMKAADTWEDFVKMLERGQSRAKAPAPSKS
jgi:hypothetical protein